MIKVLKNQIESEVIEDVDAYIRELKIDDNTVYAVSIVCSNNMDVLTASDIGSQMIKTFNDNGLKLIVFIECEDLKCEFYELKKEKENDTK